MITSTTATCKNQRMLYYMHATINNIVGFNFVGVKKLSVLCRVQQYGHVTRC